MHIEFVLSACFCTVHILISCSVHVLTIFLIRHLPVVCRYITVKVLVQQHLLYFRPNKVGEVAKELIVILTNNNISSNPMIFHVFSNGGCMVYAHLTTLISSAKSEYYQKLSVRGIIFDSTPGKRRILQAVRAFMNMLPYSVIIRYLLGMCLLVYLVVTRVVMLLLPVSIGTAKGFTLYDTISEDPAQCPQLFLYSKADSVILAEDVAEMIAARKAKGVTVKSVCWEDSHHVAHFRAHPEVYTKTCIDFVSACLALDEAKL